MHPGGQSPDDASNLLLDVEAGYDHRQHKSPHYFEGRLGVQGMFWDVVTRRPIAGSRRVRSVHSAGSIAAAGA